MSIRESWFEAREIEGKQYDRVSKFLRPEFSVSPDFIKKSWSDWSHEEKGLFAAAFAARARLGDDDREVLEFLMAKGNHDVWSLTAELVAREYPDHTEAVRFLLERIEDSGFPAANYYSALGVLATRKGAHSLREHVPLLVEKLSSYKLQIANYSPPKWWNLWERLNYWRTSLTCLDYLSCSATLFKITGEEEYRNNLKAMSEHQDKFVQMMVQSVAQLSGIAI